MPPIYAVNPLQATSTVLPSFFYYFLAYWTHTAADQNRGAMPTWEFWGFTLTERIILFAISCGDNDGYLNGQF